MTSTLPSSSSGINISSAQLPAASLSPHQQQQQQLPADFLRLEPIRLSAHPTHSNRTGAGAHARSNISYDTLSDLYALLVCCEHCETAYIRDALPAQRYTQLSSRLIAQFRTIRDTLDSDVAAAAASSASGNNSAPVAAASFDLESFCAQYGLSCRAAINRFRLGVPATVLHGDTGIAASLNANAKSDSSASQSSSEKMVVFHCAQHFITTMDCLKLNMRAVDELHPPLTDLMDSLNKVTLMPHSHECKQRVREWLLTLSAMKASQELTDEQMRQMSFEFDAAFNSFYKFLQANDQAQ